MTMCMSGRWITNCSEFIMPTRYSIDPVPAIKTLMPTETQNVTFRILSVTADTDFRF